MSTRASAPAPKNSAPLTAAQPVPPSPAPKPTPPEIASPEPPAPAPPPPSQPAPTTPSEDASSLRSAVVAALLNVKGQTSAAEQLEEATWTLTGNTLQIQTTVSKATLPILINPEAERILKATLRDIGTGQLQVKLLPGAPATNGSAKKPRAAKAGSAAELAERHPLVQEAKRLFEAELSNVIDLRKD